MFCFRSGWFHGPTAVRLWSLLLISLATLSGAFYFLHVWLGATIQPRVTTADPFEVVWVFYPPERGAIISTPLVAGNRVYVGAIRDAGLASYGVVYCLDQATGKEVWKFDNDGEMLHMYSSPCLADGRLYIGEGMHANHACKLYCLDAKTGQYLWHYETRSHIESTPCVVDGKVFFGAGDDGVYCLNAATGVFCWQFCDSVHVDTNPTVVGKCLYGGSGGSRQRKFTGIFCLSTEDGTVLWRKPTELPVWGTPTVAGDRVFFGLGNGRLTKSAEPPEKPAGTLLCVSAKTGDPLWHYAVSDSVLVKPTVDEQHVYFGARDSCCYCLTRDDGRLCWKEDVGSPVVTGLALREKHLYVVASEDPVGRLEIDTGNLTRKFSVAAQSQTKPRLLSSPIAVPEDTTKQHYRIYFGAELRNSVSSFPALYCLRD
jgi:outer membrane protein assembly factor BamB